MKKNIIYTDGGSRGNPGKAAIGVVFCDQEGVVIKKFGEYLGDNLTNNDAEYFAVIFALKKFKSFFGKEETKLSHVEVRSDSELLVRQMSGQYKVENEKIQKFFMEIWNLKVEFADVKFTAIPREENREADKLVNEVLDAKMSSQKLF